MMIALLFDWTRYPESGNYWHAIRRAVFAPGIVQRSGRHMKLSVGDVLVGIERGQDPEKLFDALFNRSEFSLFYEDRLQKGFPTIFGMVFENMPRELGAELHEALRTHKGYVGAVSVHLDYGPHLALYRNRLGAGTATISELAAPFDMALPSFMKHITVLERSRLTVSHKSGRVRTCALDRESLIAAERWFGEQHLLWQTRYSKLDSLLATIKGDDNDA